MSIKLCLLKNQQTIICDVKEMLDPEQNKSVGYMLCDPFVIESSQTHVASVDENSNVTEAESTSGQLSFGRLFNLSNERNFNVSHDFVDVIYEPHQEVTNAYLSILSKWTEEFTKTISLEKSVLVHSDEMTEEEEIRLSNIENLKTEF